MPPLREARLTDHSVRRTVSAGISRLALRRTRRLIDGYVPISDPALDRLVAMTGRMIVPDAGGLVDPRLEVAVVRAFEGLYQPSEEQDLPSPEVRTAIVDQFSRLYYHDSQRTWRETWYRGVAIRKCPLDLWIYQELIHEVQPDLIIEAGTAFGGSAYFLGDLCDTLGSGQVVSIDIHLEPDLPQHPRVTYLEGSSVDPQIVSQVAGRVPPGGTVLVILDSDHAQAHVVAEMQAYSPLVTAGSYVVVEDTNVHGHPALPSFPAGPMEAVQQFLAGTDEFVVDRSREKFLTTFNPSGYLRRVRPAIAGPPSR